MPLTPTQQKAIAALLVTRTDREAAEKAGVSAKTIQRWRSEPAFKQALESEQTKIVDVVSARIIAAADNLSKRVLDLSDNPNVEVGDFLKMIAFVLPWAVEMNDRKNILARLATLEQIRAKGSQDAWQNLDGENFIEGEVPCKKLLP